MDRARPPAPWLSTVSLRLFTLVVSGSVLPSRGLEVRAPGDVFVTAGAVATLSCTYQCEAQQQLITVVEWWRIDRPQRAKILTMDYSIIAHDHRADWIGNITSCNASISLRDVLVSDTGTYLCDVLLLPIYSEGQATLQLHVSPYDVKKKSDLIQPLPKPTPKPPTTIIVAFVLVVVVIIITVIVARYWLRPKPKPTGESRNIGGRRVNRAPCVNSNHGFTVHATSLSKCGCKECKSLLKYTHNLQQEDMASAVQIGDEDSALKFLHFRLKKQPEEEEEVSLNRSWTCTM
ncbi:uncharacterized protein LOC116949448 isoform X1 [Petromyzon marinus]|uniref:uncharacterized protein LOC116949448 isoform X1 n=1 Tax=Petromyzon marinus TaxID=7757 RepID=UPI003F6F50A4